VGSTDVVDVVDVVKMSVVSDVEVGEELHE